MTSNEQNTLFIIAHNNSVNFVARAFLLIRFPVLSSLNEKLWWNDDDLQNPIEIKKWSA